MKKKVKIGIIGLGRVFEHYLKLFRSNKIKNYQIISICDLNKKKGKIFENKLKVNFYSDFKNHNFYKDVDMVIILTLYHKDLKIFPKIYFQINNKYFYVYFS